MLILCLSQPAFCQDNTNTPGLQVINKPQQYCAISSHSPGKKLVNLHSILKPFKSDIVYATADNFTKKVLYKYHSLYLNQVAAGKLALVQDSLSKLGYNLLIFDAYRPYTVTKKMWEIVPDDRYAANPAFGSGHNRGIAVDLSLVDLETGDEIPMPTGFDNFSDSAHYDFMNLPALVIRNRKMLKQIMEHFGFVALASEWWHFSLPNPKNYPLFDLNFEELVGVCNN